MLSKGKREIIAFFAAGAAAIIGAGWAVFVYLIPPDTSNKPESCNVHSRASAVACGDIKGNVTIGAHSTR